MKFKNLQSGFTATEILIVLFIIAVLAAIVLPQFNEMRKREVLKGGANDIVTALTRARSQTLSSLESSEYGVHFESDHVIIFKGTTYSASSPDNETINIVSPATISAITLTGGGSDVYFRRLTGMPTTSGTVTISNTVSTKTITISSTGAVSVKKRVCYGGGFDRRCHYCGYGSCRDVGYPKVSINGTSLPQHFPSCFFIRGRS